MKKKSGALRMLLAVASLVISSCSGLPPAPEVKPKQPLFKKNVVRQFSVTDPENMGYTYDGKEFDRPLESVNGMFCYSLAEHQAVRNWMMTVKRDYTCKPRTKNASIESSSAE